jgi:hypothetical protein
MEPSRRLLPLSFALLVIIPLLQCQCLVPVTECDPTTCTGCCDHLGLCHPAALVANAYCGLNGQECVDCTDPSRPGGGANEVCVSGQCGPGNGDGGYRSDAGDSGTTGVDAGCNQCPNIDAVQCDPSNANEIDLCRPVNGCLKWIPGIPCPAGSTCSQGHCAFLGSDGGCAGSCPFTGDRQCDPMNPSSFELCLPINGCDQWSPPIPCPGGTMCNRGECQVGVGDGGCPNACPFTGARQCDPNSPDSYDLCENLAGCLDWSPPIPCRRGRTCVNGRCVAPSDGGTTCMNDCTVPGQQQCTGPSSGETCTADSTGCLTWVPFACAPGETCSAGSCGGNIGDAGTCANQCGFPGEQQCTGSNTGEVCVEDSDGCLAWQPFICTFGGTCSGGTCPADSGVATIDSGVTSVDAGSGVPIGSSCTSGNACNGGLCITFLPGGYCTDMCSSNQACPPYSECVTVAGFGFCAVTCPGPGEGQTSCRPGYLCWPYAGGICLPNCSQLPACPPGTSCTSAGYCQ